MRPTSVRRSIRFCGHAPDQSRGNLPTKTKIVLALPSYIRQRLSVIRRGWCPPRTPDVPGIKGVVRSDVSEAHRLSLSARVLSAEDGQVKAKQHRRKRLCRLRNRPLAYAVRCEAGRSNPNTWCILPGQYVGVARLKIALLSASKLKGYRHVRRTSAVQRATLSALRPHCHRRPPHRPPHAACGFDRPIVFDTCRWRRAASHASHVRSPCRPKSR